MNFRTQAIAMLFLGLAISGCASVETIPGPDGTPHQLVSCPDVRYCYEKAAEVCGGKYKIVNSSSSVSGSKESTSSSTEILVKCKR
ncbi:MAG: hypothetical protein IPJ84_11900 [Bdellovibrionales bacterium]|nr:hypothetical protein [Bdellovibrionales bacterium]